MDTTRYSVIVNNEDVVFIGSFDRASSVGFVRRQSGDRVVVRRVQQDDYENHSVYCEMRRLEQVAESQMEVTMHTDNGVQYVTVMDYSLDAIMHLHMDCLEAFQNGVEMWFTCTPLWEPAILRVTYRIDIVRDSVAVMSQHIRLPHETGARAF